MKVFEVKRQHDGRLIAIRNRNWNWAGFFFSWIYTAVKGLWIQTGILLAIVILMNIIVNSLNEDMATLTLFIFNISMAGFVGYYANDWLLEKYSHLPSTQVIATSKDHAFVLATPILNSMTSNTNSNELKEKATI